MSHLDGAQARLACLGQLHPDGTASFRLADPISLAQLRRLTAEDWICGVTTSDTGAGRTRFRLIATVGGRQFTVSGRIRTGR